MIIPYLIVKTGFIKCMLTTRSQTRGNRKHLTRKLKVTEILENKQGDVNVYFFNDVKK